LPPDVAPTLMHELVTPIDRQRGWVAVPTYDMRQYAQTQVITMAVGFGIGLTVGALFGNILAGSKVRMPGVGSLVKNRRRRRRTSRNPRKTAGRGRVVGVSRNPRRGTRRTSARTRKRGRPSATPVNETLVVTLPDGRAEVLVEGGVVKLDGVTYGSVYDFGTSFRAVPDGGGYKEYRKIRGAAPVRDFGTLAGAVKHVLRKAMVA
jgi:hypothetical protein